MNLLLCREIASINTPIDAAIDAAINAAIDAALPDFGAAFRSHMAGKRNKRLYQSSLAAWSLLAEGMRMLGLPLYEVRFEAGGKPVFAEAELHFSLSHSQGYAAALISTAACGVDVECVRCEVSERLADRCMHPAEIAAGLDFFTAWTRKECIAKLDGTGMPAKPSQVDSTDARYQHWFTHCINDACGHGYVLTALCQNEEPIEYES